MVLSLFMFLAGCVEPLDLNIKQQDERLVVDGLITDAPGPHTVTITHTNPVPFTPGKFPGVEGATVVITDNKGESQKLYETSPGVYLTSLAFRGVIGRTYILSITTKDRKTYISTPETLRAVPEIDNISYELEKRLALDADNQPVNVYWVKGLVDTKDPVNQKDFYKWDYTAVYQVETQPWDHTKPAPRTGNLIPDPLPCCKTCWVTLNNDVVNIQNDRLLNGKDLIKQFVVQLPVNNQVFNSRVHLQIRQYGISEEAYDYWNILKTQVNGVDNIQAPPPAFIRGNISEVAEDTNEQHKPLGYFGAAAVTSKSIFISTDALGVSLFPFVFPDDCRVIENSTAVKPAYW